MKNIILTPQYILGLTDAEGMFGLIVQKGGGPTGNKFSLEFKITQKAHSRALLEAIIAFFGCGRIAVDNAKDETLKYVVTDIVSITTVIIPFFMVNTLLSSKHMNFLSFVSMANIIESGAHLTKIGAQSLIDIYSKMNSKRSWVEKYNFMLTHTINVTSEWLQGFIDGDGSFTTWVGLSSSTRKTRHNVLQLFLEIKQNTHDVRLLQCIIDFLGIGSIKPKFDINDPVEIQTMRSTCVLVVRETAKVIEFVNKYPMMTAKRLDFECWEQLHNVKLQKLHLADEGLAQIEAIRLTMNSKRIHSS